MTILLHKRCQLISTVNYGREIKRVTLQYLPHKRYQLMSTVRISCQAVKGRYITNCRQNHEESERERKRERERERERKLREREETKTGAKNEYHAGSIISHLTKVR
jgi:predicted sulfurtransferase